MKRVLVAALLVMTSGAYAAPPADLEAYVAKAMQTFNPPGMALTVVENGETTVARAYGVRKLGEKTRANEHTIFPIGSCTKAFTSAALAILVDEGKLNWDDKVADKLPGFRMYDAFTTAEMTVRDLLVHRSGLGLGAGDLLWLGGTDFTRRQLIERLRYIKPATSFRSGYAYDNVLYIVAGQLVEQLSGMSWEAFVATRILAPLGMKDTVVPFDAPLKVANRVAPHARLDGPMRGMGNVQVLANNALDSASVAPAGSIQASAVDIAQWMKVQLARGVMPDGKRLFSESVANEMWTGQTIEPRGGLPAVLDLRASNFDLYALGWSVQDYRGHKVVQHAGAVEGGKAVVFLIPEKNVGIAAFVNSEDGAGRWAVVYHLVDHYLGLPPADWIGDYKKAVDQMQAGAMLAIKSLPMDSSGGPGANVGPSLPLEKYAGVYADPWYGTITIKPDGKGSITGLTIQFDHTPSMHGAVEHVRYDTFRTRFTNRQFEDAYLSFALKPDGTIDQIKLAAVSPLADFSYDYQDLLFTPVAAK